jgi:hypothetical protein
MYLIVELWGQVFHYHMLLKDLTPKSPSKVECPGCEESCFMSVHVRPARNQQPASAYVACDSRAEMGKVKVAMSRLRQWQITDMQVAIWLTRAFGLKGKPVRDQVSSVFTIGTLHNINSTNIICSI